MAARKNSLFFHLSIFIEENFAFLLPALRRILYGFPFRKVPLTKDKFAIVDPEDYHRLIEYKWYAHKGTNTYYAVRSLTNGKYRKRKNQYMHHLVIDIPPGRFCDHLNHNGLDNRKANLRLATHTQNVWHRRKFKSPSRSKYKGLTWRKKEKSWHVRITVNGSRLFIGSFKDEVEAACAYDRAAKILHGQFATLNSPDTPRVGTREPKG